MGLNLQCPWNPVQQCNLLLEMYDTYNKLYLLDLVFHGLCCQ